MVIGNDGKSKVDSYHKKISDTNGKSTSASLLMNGQTVRLKPLKEKEKKKKKRVFRVGNFFRIAFWYFIFTGFFCPSSNDSLTEDSSRTCKTYFQITNLVVPIIQPFYDSYAAPHLEPVLPYYVEAQRRIIGPALTYGKKYGRPLGEKTIKLGKFYWAEFAQPVAEKYYETLYQQYRQKLGPHTDKTVKAVNVYYDMIKTNVLPTYSKIIFSFYDASKPQIIRCYILVHKIVTKNIYPCVKWTVANGEFFYVRIVRPKLKSLYGESVEPQLVRISERLSKYRNARKTKSISSEVKSTLRYTTSQNSMLTPTQSVVSISDIPTSQISDSSTSEDSTGPELSVREKAQEMVTRDLKEWQEKYSNSADEAADELEIRITEITNKFISNQVDGIGIFLLKDLKEAVKTGLEELKANITSILRESNDKMVATEAISVVVRKTGTSINEKAQHLRTWRQIQNQALTKQISKALTETLDILDTIRDIGLQEVGMRWAWSEGVTYKHWTKYHAMKAKFSQWRQEVELVAIEHPQLRTARIRMDEIEMEALNIAEGTVTDLASLKEIGLWKVSVKDTSDNFDAEDFTINKASKVHENFGEVNEIKGNKLASMSSNLDILTPSLQISEVLISASHILPKAEEMVIVDSTRNSAIEDITQLDSKSSQLNPFIESKHVPETKFDASGNEFVSTSKTDGENVSERSNDVGASLAYIISAGSSTSLEESSPSESSSKISATKSLAVNLEPSSISSIENLYT